MRAVLQRVTRACVRVDGDLVGAIERGLLVYLGVAAGDSATQAEWAARKIAELRLFPDPTTEGRGFERSLVEVGGAVLLVSQFTLFAETRKGRRPSFFGAAAPDLAVPLVDAVVAALRARGIEVGSGRFGAHMLVESENDGPVTIILDSADRDRPRRA